MTDLTRNSIFILGRTEYNVVTGENVGYQHFLLFLQCFQKQVFSGLFLKKKRLLGKGLTCYHTIPRFDALKIYKCGKHHEKR